MTASFQNFLSDRPWFFFCLFLITNTFLSYAPLSLEARLLGGSVGLFLPFLYAVKNFNSYSHISDRNEFLPSIPFWFWLLIGIFAITARFAFLSSLFVWPNFDESSEAYYAIRLVQGDPLQFFYGNNQVPPLFIWCLGVFFKLFGCSIGTFRFFCALVSLSAVPLAYLASRSFFSCSFSFLITLLVAVDFWPVFVGRFGFMTGMVFPAELTVLWLLGLYLKASSEKARRNAALLLGLGLGAGFYIHLHWPVITVLVLIPLFLSIGPRLKADPSSAISILAWVIGPCLLIMAPLVTAGFREHYGIYLTQLWAFKSGLNWKPQIGILLTCLTSPFWGNAVDIHTYGPEWGGYLNPILSSFFFLGAVEVVARRHEGFYSWLLAGYGFCLLPGIITNNVETFRLFPILVIVCIICTLGLVRYWGSLPPQRNIWLLILFFAPSTLLDAFHLWVTHRFWDNLDNWSYYSKSISRYRASSILKSEFEKNGPGLIWGDFVQGLPDQSLTLATYSFNAATDPRLDPSRARWAALITNVNYQPFLKRRFPDAVSTALTKDLKNGDGGWMLFVFPLNETRFQEIKPWLNAQKALDPFILQNLKHLPGHSLKKDIELLTGLNSDFDPDPFLRASYFEKKYDLEILEWVSFAGEPMSSIDPAIEDINQAIKTGYPAAHLYEHLGLLWILDHNDLKAEKAFQQALKCPVNLTDASQYLSQL